MMILLPKGRLGIGVYKFLNRIRDKDKNENI